MSGAYEGLLNSGLDLKMVASEFGYSEPNLLILENKEIDLKNKYPEVWSNIESCRHNADKRSLFKYAQDLVASWIAEDMFLNAMNKNGLHIKTDGSDRNREILATNNVQGKSDFSVLINGKKRKIELMNDYSGFWKRNHSADLRDNKYNDIKKDEAIFVGIDLIQSFYFLKDFGKNVDGYMYYNSRFGGKRCYKMTLQEKDFKTLDFVRIAEDIKAILLK